VFTANMTGNLVLLGIAIGQGQLPGSVRAVIAFGGFAIGFLLGVRLTQGFPSPFGKGQGAGGATPLWPRSATVALIVELGLLLGMLAGWEIAGDQPSAVTLDILITLSAGAMGMQSAAARRLGVVGVTTTFVTGMLTSLIAELATGGPDRSHWTLWVATLASLLIGAAAGAAVFILWRAVAPLVAALLVGSVLVAATGLTRRSD
jgi:uncharacterized membrane protein YoaK (UPF0700 family)